MLIKDLLAMIENYKVIKERADGLRAKLRAFDPRYDKAEDEAKPSLVTAVDTEGWNIDYMLNSKGIKDNSAEIKDLILKLEALLAEMNTDTLVKT
jgi:hypothetical protein